MNSVRCLAWAIHESGEYEHTVKVNGTLGSLGLEVGSNAAQTKRLSAFGHFSVLSQRVSSEQTAQR